MPVPDPQAVVRRAVLAAGALLYLVLAVHTAYHIETILSWEPLLSASKLTASGISLVAGLFTTALLILDLLGRPAPIADALKPAWLVVGADLVHSYFLHGFLWLLVPGVVALLMGVLGTVALWRGRPVGSDKASR